MIHWNKVNDKIPPVNNADEYDKKQQSSKRVLTFFDEDDGLTPFWFGRYYHSINHWVIEGRKGFDQRLITHWAELNAPDLRKSLTDKPI